MPGKYLLALDAGTSSLRSLIFDRQGCLISAFRGEYIFHRPVDAGLMGIEFEAEELWNCVKTCIAGSLAKTKIDPRDIAGISATSQREGAVFLDGKGCELYAGPNLDLRAVMEGLAMDERSAGLIHSITGHLPSLMFIPARLRWFRQHQPEIYSQIAGVLSITDWLLFRLCGVKSGEICGAVELGLADVVRRAYSKELMELFGLPLELLPELAPSGSCLGRLTPAAAADTGLDVGTIVVQGGPDTHCGLAGCGVKVEGQAGIISGWSTPVQMVAGKPLIDDERRVWTGCHIIRENWIMESNSGESGRAWKWVKDNLYAGEGRREDDVYRLMEHEAGTHQAGAEGTLAVIGPEALNMGQPGMRWGGFYFPVPFSASNIDRSHLARAALENIAYAIKANILQIQEISGQDIGEVRMGGGLARNACLKNILPSILERPVSMALVTETSGLGAAMLAACGCGIYSSLDEALEEMQSPLDAIEPDQLMAAEYREHYGRWLKLGEGLKRISEELD